MEKNRILESERVTTNDEIQRVMDEKTKQRNDILHLKQKIATTENHAETLRKSIKTKESLMDNMKNEMDSMKSEILKLREEQNISILAGRSNSKDLPMDSNGENVKENKDTDNQTRIEKMLEEHLRKVDIQDQLNEFSHDILAKVSQLVEEKLSGVENKIQTLASIPEEMNKNYKTFSETLQTNLPPHNVEQATPNIKVMVKEAIMEQHNDEESREDRKKNIIIFNAKESKADTLDERKIHDTSLFIDACNSICDNIPTSEVIQVRRLGKRSEDICRPLIVKVKTETTKRRIFSQLHKLRDKIDFASMSMSHDMTKEERIQTKVLVEKAKQMTKDFTENNESDVSKNWIFRVRGPPWNQRIQKIRLRIQQ